MGDNNTIIKENERLKFELCYLKSRNKELCKQIENMGATIARLASEKRSLELKQYVKS